MIRSLTPLQKLIIVVAVQFVVLFSVLGFKQYTVWTGETVLLRVIPVDPTDPFRGDFASVRYEISTLRAEELDGDRYVSGTVYVELREDRDGYADAVAIHDQRERSFDGTLLIKGKVLDAYYESQRNTTTYVVEYGIEEIFIEDGTGANFPSPDEGTLAVEVKVDRFGNAVARRFMLDGEPLDLDR
jgi:uncharacterized membrane-anchored protein